MNKRLKKVYRIYYQLRTDVWGDVLQYNKIRKQRFISSRPKTISLTIENARASRIPILNKYNSIQQIKKYYLNVSKKFINKVIHNLNYYIKHYNSILNVLESRLDTIVYRCNWCTSMLEARQMISHGYFHVNGLNVNSSNLVLKKGDIIEVNKKYTSNINSIINKKLDINNININVPEYLEVNYNTLQAVLLYYPENYQIPYPTLTNVQSFSDFSC